MSKQSKEIFPFLVKLNAPKNVAPQASFDPPTPFISKSAWRRVLSFGMSIPKVCLRFASYACTRPDSLVFRWCSVYVCRFLLMPRISRTWLHACDFLSTAAPQFANPAINTDEPTEQQITLNGQLVALLHEVVFPRTFMHRWLRYPHTSGVPL
jgi:hypothetical protein